MPNYRRYYLPSHAVFITVVTHDRNPRLADDAVVKILRDSMNRAKTLYPFRHLAHVILQDHLHWLLEPAIPNDLPRIIAAVKRNVTWQLKDRGKLLPGYGRTGTMTM